MRTKSELNKSGIYKITNKINGKFYIGSALNIRKRWKSHRNLLRKNKHFNKHFQSAVNKYGLNNFLWEVIEFADQSCLVVKEQCWIDKLTAYDRKIGYNLSPTAFSNFGIKHSAKSRKNMSLAHIGKKQTKKTKRKISQSQYKSVCQIDINGNIIKEFPSCIEAEKCTGTYRQSISMCCRGIMNYANGYQWRYKDDIKSFVSKLPKGCKPIVKIVDNKIVERWYSIAEAVKNTGIPRISICRKLKVGVEYKYV